MFINYIVSGLMIHCLLSFSKYFLSTGLTMKCRAEATLTRPAMVYIVLLYRKGLGSTVPAGMILISLEMVRVLA